jgi:hypothetical protein
MPLMKITKDSQDLVVIEHKPGLFEYVLSIASIFLIYTFFEILLLTPEDKKNLLGAAFGCIFIISALALFYEQNEFKFNPISRQLSWKRNRFYKKTEGMLFFHNIKNVVIQTYSKKNSSLSRVVLKTDKEDLPLTISYIGNHGCRKVTDKLHSLLEFESRDLVMDSVFEMVSKGKEIEAIKFLRNEKEISLTKAQQIVKDIKKQIQ